MALFAYPLYGKIMKKAKLDISNCRQTFIYAGDSLFYTIVIKLKQVFGNKVVNMVTKYDTTSQNSNDRATAAIILQDF